MYWLTASSHRAGLASSSEGGMRMDWCPEYTLQEETRVSEGEAGTVPATLPAGTFKPNMKAWAGKHSEKHKVTMNCDPRSLPGCTLMGVI